MCSISRVLALLLVLLLSACSDTKFLSLPSGETSDCDQRFVGTWRVIEQSDDKDGPDYLAIEPDCKRIIGSKENEHEDLREDTELRFHRGKYADYLVLRDLPDADSESDAEPEGHGLMRYRIKRDRRIEVFGIDHRQIALMLVDGRLHGNSKVNAPKQGSITYDNLVDSNSEELDRALKDRRAFERKPAIVLERVSKEEYRRAHTHLKTDPDDHE